MKDEDKNNEQFISELSKSHIRNSELKSTETKSEKAKRLRQIIRFWLCAAGMLFSVCLLVWINEIFDFSYLSTGKPSESIDLLGTIIVMMIVIAFGLFTMSKYIHCLNKQIKIKEVFHENEEKYQNLLERSNDGIAIIQDKIIKYANQRLVDMWDHNVDEMIGTLFVNYIHPEEVEKLVEVYEKRLEGKEVKPTHRAILLRKDGSERYIELNGGLITYKGKPADLVIVRDISEIKIAKDALRESDIRYRLLFDNANDAVFIVQDGVIKFSNQKTRDMSGYTAEELAKISFIEFVHPDDKAMILERYKRRLRGDKFESVFSFKIFNKGGEEFWVKMRSVVTMWEGKSATLNFLRDITAQKKLEVQFRQAQKMKAVGTLAGGISHDFNNLLQAILGYTQILLLDKQSTDQDFGRLKAIERTAFRATDLIRQLLTFSRKVESKLRPLNLNQEVRSVEKILKRTIPKMIDIHLQLDENLNIVNADSAQIEQVLMNLSINARDSMPNGGELVIKTENVILDKEYSKTHLSTMSGKAVLLSVSDTGHGMERETLDHIFEPFYTTKETGKGTGLGLSMVYGIVENHGGFINCYSEPRKGTIFKIYFPSIYNENDAYEEKRTDQEEMPSGTETILLVDDEVFLRNLGEQMLTRYGYMVLKACDGESALKLYHEKKGVISLVILDLMMPGMGGQRCLEELLRIDPGVKVVITSGYSIDEHTREAIEAGAKGFIEKPYNLHQLLKTVRNVLDQKNDH